MIRKFALGLVSVVALTASANAADIYRGEGGSLKDGPVYAPVTSWTGFYLGVNGGYAWQAENSKLSMLTNDDDNANVLLKRNLESDGGFGGGQIGYNVGSLGFGSGVVFGIEADFQGGSISDKGAVSAVLVSAENELYEARAKSELNWFGTVRGRLGYAVDRTLIYATGGFAYGNVKDKLNVSVNSGTPTSLSVSNDETLTGYAVGGGLEHKLSPSWSLKAEYQYIDLGTSNLTATLAGVPDAGGGADGNSASFKADHTYHTVRIGLNYHVGQAYEPLK